MQISPSKFTGALVGIAIILMLGGGLYFLYGLFFLGPKPQESVSIDTLNVGILKSKMQKAGSALVGKNKVSLRKQDIVFAESALYKSFTDIPEGVPLSDSRGREDPFAPYVAP